MQKEAKDAGNKGRQTREPASRDSSQALLLSSTCPSNSAGLEASPRGIKRAADDGSCGRRMWRIAFKEWEGKGGGG